MGNTVKTEAVKTTLILSTQNSRRQGKIRKRCPVCPNSLVSNPGHRWKLQNAYQILRKIKQIMVPDAGPMKAAILIDVTGILATRHVAERINPTVNIALMPTQLMVDVPKKG